MRRELNRSSSKTRWRILWLATRVYWDGFRADPAGFLQAVWWRGRGLKQRSRHRLAALIGKSPNAYCMWLDREAARLRQDEQSVAEAPMIFALVDCRKTTSGLAETLDSIALAGWSPVVMGSQVPAEGVRLIRGPEDIPDLIDADSVWICPMAPGDLLAPTVRTAYAAMMPASASILYADDDLIRPDAELHEPHFKPDWNAELFRHHDFLSNACLLAIDQKLATSLPDEDWPLEIIRRLLDGGAHPLHVPKILHHRRNRPDPQVPLDRLTLPGSQIPSVSVLIPTRDQANLLATCIEGVERTNYPVIEVIIVDNGSEDLDALALIRRHEENGVRVLRRPGPFNFSALNNEAARLATGDVLCLLNNDVEVIDPAWLETMVVQALRREVGAVGARLLYADGTIQHAGVVIGLGGAAGHAHRFQAASDPGYFERARLPQFTSAVTAACLVLERRKFEAVGGFDAEQFPVAFNDVDLCLRLNEKGWQSLYEPRATLVHHESKSRGKDATVEKRARFARELAALKNRWGTDRHGDPFHHPSLSRFSETFVVDLL